MKKTFFCKRNIYVLLLSVLMIFSFTVFCITVNEEHVANAIIVLPENDGGGGNSSSSDSGSSSESGSESSGTQDPVQDEDTSFHLRKAVSLSLSSDLYQNGQGMRIGFYVPQDYMTEYLKGYHRVSQYPKDGYIEHYFRVVRFNDLSYFYKDSTDFDYEQYYSIDPTSSTMSTTSLLSYEDQGDGRYFCYATLPMPSESTLDVEYYYCVDYVARSTGRSKEVWSSNKFRLIPISDENTIDQRTENYIQFSVSYVANSLLNSSSGNYTADQTRYLQHLAGINVSSDVFPVILSYKRCTGFNQVEDVSATYSVNSLYAGINSLMYSSVMGLHGVKSESDFNCVFRNVNNVVVDGAEMSTLLDERIILQADGYTCEFDSVENIGYITINYRQFAYKDFAIEVKDNDDSDGKDLTFYAYPVDVESVNGIVTLTYNYSDIQNMVLHSCGWLFELSRQNFTVVGTNAYVTVNVGDNELTVSFAKSNEDKLLGLRISCLAAIIEDYEVSVTIQYASLDNDLNETLSSQTLNVFYSEYLNLTLRENFYAQYGSTIESTIHPLSIKGLSYYVFSDVECTKLAEGKFRIVVEYSYNTLLKLTNSYNDDVVYQGLTKNSNVYYGSDLDYTLDPGLRISSLSSTDNRSVTIINNEEYFNETRIDVHCHVNEKKIIPLRATVVDTWHVKLNYLEQYKDTCFAEKKEALKDVAIAEYGDIRSLSLNDVKSIYGFSDLGVLKSYPDNEIKVEFNGQSTYTLTLTYGFAVMRMSEASGINDEVQVPLTSYADWCLENGKNWSILYLNNPEHTYFRYVNEIPKENLYGYFSVIVFKEQTIDINSWFAQESGEGAVVLSRREEIRGSDFYKFTRKSTSIFAAVGGLVGLSIGGPAGFVGGAVVATGINVALNWIQELVGDDNATYYTYFFYLDCSSDSAFLSRSGATDAYDTDGAFTNTVQKAGSDIESFFAGFSKAGNTFMTVLTIILGAVGVIGILLLVVKLVSAIKGKGKKNE